MFECEEFIVGPVVVRFHSGVYVGMFIAICLWACHRLSVSMFIARLNSGVYVLLCPFVSVDECVQVQVCLR